MIIAWLSHIIGLFNVRVLRAQVKVIDELLRVHGNKIERARERVRATHVTGRSIACTSNACTCTLAAASIPLLSTIALL